MIKQTRMDYAVFVDIVMLDRLLLPSWQPIHKFDLSSNNPLNTHQPNLQHPEIAMFTHTRPTSIYIIHTYITWYNMYRLWISSEIVSSPCHAFRIGSPGILATPEMYRPKARVPESHWGNGHLANKKAKPDKNQKRSGTCMEKKKRKRRFFSATVDMWHCCVWTGNEIFYSWVYDLVWCFGTILPPFFGIPAWGILDLSWCIHISEVIKLLSSPSV